MAALPPPPQVIYMTKDGDVLDKICFDYYGDDAAPLQAVYNANPGLADLGPVYAENIPIVMPDLSTADVAETTPIVNPWSV